MAMQFLVTTYGAITFLAVGSASVRADPEVQGIAIATGIVVIASILADTVQREEPNSIAFEVGRFGLDLEYRFDNGMRIGAGYQHISNGKVLQQTNNPGTEVIGVTFSLPIR